MQNAKSVVEDRIKVSKIVRTIKLILDYKKKRCDTRTDKLHLQNSCKVLMPREIYLLKRTLQIKIHLQCCKSKIHQNKQG